MHLVVLWVCLCETVEYRECHVVHDLARCAVVFTCGMCLYFTEKAWGERASEAFRDRRDRLEELTRQVAAAEQSAEQSAITATAELKASRVD
mgnify:CR=1 FL=1